MEFQTIVTIMIVVVVVSGGVSGSGGNGVIVVCFGDGGVEDDGVPCSSDGDDCGINDSTFGFLLFIQLSFYQ